jgi:hypothetical protein
LGAETDVDGEERGVAGATEDVAVQLSPAARFDIERRTGIREEKQGSDFSRLATPATRALVRKGVSLALPLERTPDEKCCETRERAKDEQRRNQ